MLRFAVLWCGTQCPRTFGILYRDRACPSTSPMNLLRGSRASHRWCCGSVRALLADETYGACPRRSRSLCGDPVCPSQSPMNPLRGLLVRVESLALWRGPGLQDYGGLPLCQGPANAQGDTIGSFGRSSGDAAFAPCQPAEAHAGSFAKAEYVLMWSG